MSSRFNAYARQDGWYQSVYNALKPRRDAIIQHELYDHIQSISDLRLFVESHVFAVWDFMTLLKSLQNKMTCTVIPWMPKGNSKLTRLINDIVLNEESDEIEPGTICSHFEYYLKAMLDLKADTTVITDFLFSLNGSRSLHHVLLSSNLREHVVQFINTTWQIASECPSHEIAAAFTFGREELIPDMFSQLINQLYKKDPEPVYKFKRYLDRHIEIDSHDHGPMAIVMLETLCSHNQKAWDECYEVGVRVLDARKLLWDGILHQIHAARNHPGQRLRQINGI